VIVIWFIVWLIANNVEGHEPLILHPVNAWTENLILAIRLGPGAAHAPRHAEEPLVASNRIPVVSSHQDGSAGGRSNTTLTASHGPKARIPGAGTDPGRDRFAVLWTLRRVSGGALASLGRVAAPGEDL